MLGVSHLGPTIRPEHPQAPGLSGRDQRCAIATRSTAKLVRLKSIRSRAIMKRRGREAQRKGKGSIEQCLLCRGENTNEVRQRTLWQAHQLIAVNTAFVFQALIETDVYLGMQTVSALSSSACALITIRSEASSPG